MGSYGREELTQTVGRSIQLQADGKPEFKEGGVTVDWATVQAVAGADVTYPDGVKVRIGEKALRYGQPLGLITASGKYGPFDSTAADGRENPAAGRIVCVNETRHQNDVASDHPPVLVGGKVWKARLIMGAATQITEAQLRAALPRMYMVAGT